MANNTDSHKLVFDLLKDIGQQKDVPLSEEIFTILRNAIIQGELPEGFSFPNEIDMSKELRVGRSTIREAYSSLASLDLITRTKNGTIVNSQNKVRNLMNFDVIADKVSLLDVIEFRSILETGIAYNAALFATNQDIKDLEDILERQFQSVDDIEKLTELDYVFHRKLADASKNELLMLTLESSRPYYEGFIYTIFNQPPRYLYSLNEHKDILNAVKTHDPKLAKDCMRIHLDNLRKFAENVRK